ncbi:MAG: ATP-binding cassette domain-containing protein [Gammaproteobacteria bacterium]|nr:ATP-binding cassette domain-containing protein [Gammaproteobacteria bacterium]MCP5195416.1 ATP-binding cassette domain-containing protein [Gammaproteobacteria bacterium]
MSKPLIFSQNLTYRYPSVQTPALQDLAFTVEAGEFVLLAGASGSGKSTLCRLLNGLIPHLHGGELQGDLRIAGIDPRAASPHQLSHLVGLLLQRPDAQCLATTVARDLAFGPACQGWDRPTIARRVCEVVERLDIAHLLDRSPYTLSCGEQQRVALAGVLAMQPGILVLDEPFAFLDTAGASQLRERLRRLHAAGSTVLIAEHRLEELADLANRVLVLHQGRLVADGTPNQVLTSHLADWGLEAPESLPVSPPSQAATREPVTEWDGIQCERDGRAVLYGASLAVAAGEIVALLGANGAGKSTLLRHGNGLLRAQGGEVRVLGQPIGRRPVAELAGEVGLVMQQPTHMLFAPTVRDELAAGPHALRRYDPAWCAQLSERFGLNPLLDRPPHTLSAGQQRRLAIAAILASRPRVLLLDEPTAGQDAAARAALRTLLQECAAEGVAITVATHDPLWARSLCQRWAVLAEGRIVTPADDSLAAGMQHSRSLIPSQERAGASITHRFAKTPASLLEKEEKEWSGQGERFSPLHETAAPQRGEDRNEEGERCPDSHSLMQRSDRTGCFDPRALLVVYLLGCGLILLATRPLELLPLFTVPLLGIAFGRYWGAWRRVMRLLWPTLLSFAIIVGLGSGLEAATGAVLRLLALVTASVWFFALTPPEALGEALLASGLSPQGVFLLEGTLRFAPAMATLAREVREAQESRGIRLDGVYLLRNGVALLAPLLTSVMRFADDLAEALETRGFGGPTRTPLAEYRFQIRDWRLVSIALAGGGIAAAGLIR